MQLLPSFQSFLESARRSPPSPIIYKQHANGYESADGSYHTGVRMYQLASLTAREYERAMRSPDDNSSVGSWSPTATDGSSSDEDSSAQPRVVATTSRMPVAKGTKKKYLKEKQRCEIVRRVRGGEKQAHLAKEFGVSRAAVCYLLKHQTEILSRCGDDGERNLPTARAD